MYVYGKSVHTHTHTNPRLKDMQGKCGSQDMKNFNWLPAAGCVSAAYLTVCTLAASDGELISSTKGTALERCVHVGRAGHQVYNLLN